METGIGELNPLPFQCGGGPSPTSKAYALIRKAVGEGGSASDDRGIEGLWRRSRAHGLAAATSATERAVLQLDPDLATDFLPSYERVLAIVPPAGASRATRAAEASSRWTAQIDALSSSIVADLAAIDPRLSVPTPNYDHGATTQDGRALEPFNTADEGPVYGGIGYSLYPAYATSFMIRVLFDVGHNDVLSASEQRVVQRAREYLLETLPSWICFEIRTGGWHLGHTPLGLGGLG